MERHAYISLPGLQAETEAISNFITSIMDGRKAVGEEKGKRGTAERKEIHQLCRRFRDSVMRLILLCE